MKRVYVHAYLQGNLGDDLFVKTLCRRYPNITFYVLADEVYKNRFRDLQNCKVRSVSDKRVRIADKVLKHFKNTGSYLQFLIKYSQAVIHIGGSSFVQHNDDWTDFYNYDRMLVRNSKKLYLIGANFGPYRDQGYYDAYHKLFQRYEGICFRDKYSWNLFQDIPQVSYAPDVLFQLKNNSEANRKKKKKVIISLIELQHRCGNYDISVYEEGYIKFHVELIRYFIRKKYTISLLSFCQNEMDDAMIQKVCERLSDVERKSVLCMAYQIDADPVLLEIEDAEMIVGTRFHSVILGFLYGCKVLPIVYDQKTEKVLEELKYPLSLKLSDLEQARASEIGKRVMDLSPLDVRDMIGKSSKQFQYTDKLFASKN